MHSLYQILAKLDEGNWHYTLSRHRPDTIMVSVTFVGERVEIDIFEDGSMEVSRFIGNEEIVGDEKFLLALLDKKSDEKEG